MQEQGAFPIINTSIICLEFDSRTGHSNQILRRVHVSCFSRHSHIVKSQSAFAMFNLELWTELEGKHCRNHYYCDCDYDNDKKQDTKSVLQSWVWFKLFWICLATIPPLLKDAKYTNGMGPKLYCRWNAKLYEYNSNRNLLTWYLMCLFLHNSTTCYKRQIKKCQAEKSLFLIMTVHKNQSKSAFPPITKQYFEVLFDFYALAS